MSQHGVLLAVMAGIILSAFWPQRCRPRTRGFWPRRPACPQDLMQHSFGIKMNSAHDDAAATVICIAIIGMVLARGLTAPCSVSFPSHGPASARLLARWCCSRCSGSARTSRARCGHDHWRRGGLLESTLSRRWAAHGPSTGCSRVPFLQRMRDRDRIARDARRPRRHRYLRRDLQQIKGKNRRGLRPSLLPC